MDKNDLRLAQEMADQIKDAFMVGYYAGYLQGHESPPPEEEAREAFQRYVILWTWQNIGK